MSGSRIAVLGPGGVGGLVAAVLWKHGHAVTCVAREETAEQIAREGLQLNSVAFGTIHAHPRAVARLDQPVELFIVATKATTLREALERVAPQQLEAGVVVPLLNGIEHMQVLRSRYGHRVVAASIGGVEAMKRSAAHIVHTTASAKIELASDGEVSANCLSEIAGLLADCGIATEMLASEAQVLWGKLVRLNALACTTSASGRTIGEVRSDPWWRKQLMGCVQEGAAVASAEGVPMEVEEIMAQVDRFPAGIGTSMQRDIAAGRPSELDAIAGAVVRAGRRRGLDCPVIQSLIMRLEAQIAGRNTAQHVGGAAS